MKIECNDIRELNGEDQTLITGGGYAESSLGLVSGLALGAGVLAATPISGPFLLTAFAVGAAFLLYDSF